MWKSGSVGQYHMLLQKYMYKTHKSPAFLFPNTYKMISGKIIG